ncbi:MAG: radical SAM protein [Armatimonadetes bacterium]|nr:radical SAM protein [Armatimonadota bacterium]
MPAAYLAQHESGELATRIERALGTLRECRLCPHECRVDRTAEKWGRCRTGRKALVSSVGPHFGEEEPLVGRGGSGTIFLASCNLACIFCQNYDLSQLGHGRPADAAFLARAMVGLQKHGCENINFVTPTHVLPQLLEALPEAVEKGLRVPLVWNCGGYESLESLALLEGIVDIYMPDLKYADAATAERLSGVRDYPARAFAAVREMHRQVGDLALDERGVATRGLLVRHLVLPQGLAGTAEVMRFLGAVSPNTYVNVMAQYRPCHRAHEEARLTRGLTTAEYRQAVQAARNAGLTRLDARPLERMGIV